MQNESRGKIDALAAGIGGPEGGGDMSTLRRWIARVVRVGLLVLGVWLIQYDGVPAAFPLGVLALAAFVDTLEWEWAKQQPRGTR